MPAATQDGLLNALNALRDDGRSELTLLVLGKGGVGKSRCVRQWGCCSLEATAAAVHGGPAVHGGRAGTCWPLQLHVVKQACAVLSRICCCRNFVPVQCWPLQHQLLRRTCLVLTLQSLWLLLRSTINSLLNERVAPVTAFQQDTAKATVYRWGGRAGRRTHVELVPPAASQVDLQQVALAYHSSVDCLAHMQPGAV